MGSGVDSELSGYDQEDAYFARDFPGDVPSLHGKFLQHAWPIVRNTCVLCDSLRVDLLVSFQVYHSVLRQCGKVTVPCGEVTQPHGKVT
jgi:hypothetical protein